MKKFILPLVMICALIACDDENPQPVNDFSGTWNLTEPEVPMQISFEIPKDNPGTFSASSKVVHPLIPESEEANNNMFFYDKFENGNGWGKVEIISRGTFHYIVTLIYNRFDEEGNMLVYDVQVDIAGQDYFILQDRIFTRK